MFLPRLKLMFSHRSVQIMAAMWLLGWGVLGVTQSWHLLWLAPLGVLAQMLNEYSVHRFLFHWPAPKRQSLFDLLYLAHYGHHDFPSNPALFFVPVWFAIPMLVLHLCLATLAAWLLGFANPVAAAAAFTLVGGVGTFIAYEWFHMTAHTNVRKFALERRVTRLHGMHHFRDYERWYHVNPGGEIIDKLMGTGISNAEMQQKSRRALLSTLGLAKDDPRLLAARARFAGSHGIPQE